jgi:hypothetical protein
VNRRTTYLAAVPLLLVVAGCGGHKEQGSAPETTATPATAAARHSTPSAAPTTDAPGHDEVEAQVKQALVAAHAPGDGQFNSHGCAIGYSSWDIGMHYPRFRKDVVAALHAAGWKDAPGGGPDETVLANPAGWEVFVDQRDVGKLNGTGSPSRMLEVKAVCA